MTKIAAVCTLLCSVAGLATAASSTAASASTFLSDGTFSDVTVTANNSASQGTTVSTSAPCASCGNPGAGLQATVVGNASAAAMTDVGFIDNLLSYNPGVSGAISSITAQYDRAITASFAFSIGLTLRLVIEQGGLDYVTSTAVSGGPDTGGGVYHTLGPANLLATDFSQINFATGVLDSSSHPNFSAGAILFGIEQLSNTPMGGTVTGSYDNLDITVNQTPLPAALPLFATGLGGLGLLGWRRKWKAQAGV